MKVENPAAWHFIMQDDIYFLNKDRNLYENAAIPVPVDEPVTPVTAIEAPAPLTPVHFGKNKKGFLVLVHYIDLEFIAESHLAALENILKRKGFELDDVAILNMAKHGAVNFESLKAYFKPQKMLLLGKNAMPAGLRAITLNEPTTIDNIMALYSFSFDEMMDSNELKKAFWDQMKVL